MSASNSNYTLQIRRRPWWFWLVAILWLLLVLFFLNVGVASAAELEPQASLVAYGATLVLVVIGIVVYIVDRRKGK